MLKLLESSNNQVRDTIPMGGTLLEIAMFIHPSGTMLEIRNIIYGLLDQMEGIESIPNTPIEFTMNGKKLSCEYKDVEDIFVFRDGRDRVHWRIAERGNGDKSDLLSNTSQCYSVVFIGLLMVGYPNFTFSQIFFKEVADFVPLPILDELCYQVLITSLRAYRNNEDSVDDRFKAGRSWTQYFISEISSTGFRAKINDPTVGFNFYFNFGQYYPCLQHLENQLDNMSNYFNFDSKGHDKI